MLKLWLLPKVWLQGSQSTTTGGSSLTKAKPDPSIAWFEHSMRCVLMTALGFPVEPEVNRNLAIVSGDTARCAAATPVASSRAKQIGEHRCLAIAERIAGHDQLDLVRHRFVDGPRKRSAVSGKNEAGREQVDDGAQLAEVVRHQRIGRRDRRVGNADIHRSESEQCVLDVIAGQHSRAAARRTIRVAAVRPRYAAHRRASRHRSASAIGPVRRVGQGTERSGAALAQCSSGSLSLPW